MPRASTLHWSGVAGAAPCHVALVPIAASGSAPLVHDHADFHELFYVTAGRGRHETGGVTQYVSAGDLVLVRPHDRHVLRTAPGPEALTIVNVAFPSTAWWAFLELAGLTAAAGWDTAPTSRRVTDVNGALVPVVAELLDRHPSGTDARGLVGLWLAATELLLDQPERHPPDTTPPWLLRACAAMQLEDNLRAGVPRFVRLAGVSPGHLARTLRTHRRCTPVEFVVLLRVDLAASLLETTAEPIGRVAERCGFNSPSYFARVFTRAHGQNPRAYRETTRRKVVP